MAGEITGVTVTPEATSRNSVRVSVNHLSPASWSGGNGGHLRFEYSLDGGTTWVQPANVYGTAGLCNTPLSNPISPLTVSNTTVDVWATSIPHNAAVSVRVTALDPADAPIDSTTAGPATTTNYPQGNACGTTNITENSANLRVTHLGGTFNLSGCDTDTVVWEYGTTPGGPYPNVVPSAQVSSQSPQRSVTGLTPGTTYYYRAHFTEVVESNAEFLVTPQCQFATALQGGHSETCTPATGITATGATIGGSADAVAPSDFLRLRYGTVSGGPYPTTAGAQDPGTSAPGQTITRTLTGLTTGTTYYYRTEVVNGSNLVSYGTECSFTAQAPASYNPQTQPATGITATGATLHGTADGVPVNRFIRFGWSAVAGGPYTFTPNQAGDTTTPQAVSAPLTGLTPATPYFFVTQVVDTNGTTVLETSTEATFTTGATVTTPPFNPQPCAAGGSGAAGADVEGTLVCDVNAGGDVVGVALVEAVYDAAGARTGTRLVNVVTGATYVPQGTIQACREGCCPEPVVLCDVQADNSVVQFIRTYTGDASGNVDTKDQLLDGSVYTPTGTVGSCEPYSRCTPSPDIDLGADCGPGQSPNLQFIAAQGFAPNSTVNDDASADPLCGGQWTRASQPESSPFPINETFRNSTYDQAGPVTQGSAPYFQLTAPSIDAAGQGWGRGSDVNSFTNGFWQVPNSFPASPGMTAEITFASHDGTSPGGDGWVFGFTDGSIAPQSSAVGGGGSLGLVNWQGGYAGIVLDEYGGTGAGGNTISIQGLGTHAGNIIADAYVNPHSINLTTRAQPLRLRTSIITQFGETYMSASIDWNDGNGFVQYFDRVRVDNALGAAPATLRMGTNASSGGAFRSIKEQRDAVAHQAGIEQWRAFPITTDPIPACVTLTTVRVCVDLTFTSDTQTAGNSEADAWLLLVNTATNTVVGRASRTSTPNQVGTAHNMCAQADVAPADIPNLRIYVGADTRDASGAYSTLWENLKVTATGTGCPAQPVRTLAISAPCPLPVTIVGGSASGGGGGTTVFNAPSTFEDAPVCMTVSGSTVPGLRREVRNADGTVTVTFLGADGLVVTPDSWTPGGCSVRDTEVLSLCDVRGDGTAITFLRVFTYDQNGTLVHFEDQDPAGAAYTPTGIVATCDQVVRESYILCDVHPPNGITQFIRTTVRVAGGLAAVLDTQLDGATPYFPTGAVTDCLGETVDRETMCWTQTSTGTQVHTGTIRHDDNLPAPGWILFDQNQNPVFSNEPGLTFVPCGGRDTEVLSLCDVVAGVPVPFLRRQTFDQDGAVISTVDTTPAGAAYTVAGAVAVCTELDAETQVLCDSGNANHPYILRLTYNTTSGLLVGSSTTNLDGSAYTVVGTPVICGGSTTATLNSQHFDVLPGVPWTPAVNTTGVLTSVTYTVLSGTASVTDASGDTVTGIPAGYVATWQAEDSNTLTPPQSIASVGGRIIVHWTSR